MHQIPIDYFTPIVSRVTCGNTIFKMKQSIYIVLTLLSITMLSACSSGGDDTNAAGGGRGGTQNGFLNLSITDAPVDGATEVWVQFDSITLKPASDPDVITLEFDPPMTIDLLTLQGQNSLQMLFNETLPTGIYEWLRMNITASNDGVMDSYIRLLDNSVHDLDIPSGGDSGLKIIGGLEIIANTPTNMIIDFDLRKSIVMTGTGVYSLIPALKLVDGAETGSITGTVELAALTDPSCPDADLATGNAVYLFDSFNITPDDMDNIGIEPVASVIPALNNATGKYEYSFGFVPLGKYTAAFTCFAELDNPEKDDAITFGKTKNINLVTAQAVKTITFR